MSYNEEQLPLYIPREKNITTNIPSNNSKYLITFQKQINDSKKPKNKKSKEIPDKKKPMSTKKNNKIITALHNFFNILFNNKNKKIILFFFILIFSLFLKKTSESFRSLSNMNLATKGGT